MLLTEQKIRSALIREKNYRIADGSGLYLLTSKSGCKRWVFRYRYLDKEKSISLGKYPLVPLAEAREKRSAASKLIQQQIDPCVHKRQDRLHAKFRDRNAFREVAEEWYDNNRAGWCQKYQKKTWNSLEKYVLPYLGSLPIAEIKPLDVLRVIQRIETNSGTYLSRRQAETCKRVFSYGVVTGRIEHNPAADLNAGMRPHRSQHHRTLRPSQVGDFLQAFEAVKVNEIHRLAFKLLFLTALRTGELRYSKWEQIDFRTSEWEIPKEMMKMREEHVVPLSHQAISALRKLHELTGHQEWLFPNQNPLRHPVISENFATNLIEKMGYKGRIVGHGLRALFSTIANEHELCREAVERQLAHRERNSVRAAYNRAQYFEKRKEIMQWWADFLDRQTLYTEVSRTIFYSHENASSRGSENHVYRNHHASR